MYKVTYSFLKGNPSGGIPKWTTEFKLYNDTLSADELQAKIDVYLKDDRCGYHKHIAVSKIERI